MNKHRRKTILKILSICISFSCLHFFFVCAKIIVGKTLKCYIKKLWRTILVLTLIPFNSDDINSISTIDTSSTTTIFTSKTVFLFLKNPPFGFGI